MHVRVLTTGMALANAPEVTGERSLFDSNSNAARGERCAAGPPGTAVPGNAIPGTLLLQHQVMLCQVHCCSTSTHCCLLLLFSWS